MEDNDNFLIALFAWWSRRADASADARQGASAGKRCLKPAHWNDSFPIATASVNGQFSFCSGQSSFPVNHLRRHRRHSYQPSGNALASSPSQTISVNQRPLAVEVLFWCLVFGVWFFRVSLLALQMLAILT
jgi:hypothetical protein